MAKSRDDPNHFSQILTNGGRLFDTMDRRAILANVPQENGWPVCSAVQMEEVGGVP